MYTQIISIIPIITAKNISITKQPIKSTVRSPKYNNFSGLSVKKMSSFGVHFYRKAKYLISNCNNIEFVYFHCWLFCHKLSSILLKDCYLRTNFYTSGVIYLTAWRIYFTPNYLVSVFRAGQTWEHRNIS